MVVGRDLDTGHLGQCGRQQRLLQRAREPLHPVAFALGFFARPQQFLLVGPPVAGVEIVVRISCACPSVPVLTVEVTSTGSRLPSAAFSSKATPPSSPCMRRSGAKCVSW
ncbi:hypothetical protein [Amycolatopsis sp.]|uniref:hypothetical protein n=1 Tax=Amycolatopsis sp. TaxID=37632 RepID=UPI002D7EC95F|nr:hypothetical protein [Amycolatopsis sp.]HET6708582.1 hypothetical protein [Amycolatopsis sp.]